MTPDVPSGPTSLMGTPTTPGSGQPPRRSRSRIGGAVQSQPGSRSTSPSSLRSYQTYNFDPMAPAGGASTVRKKETFLRLVMVENVMVLDREKTFLFSPQSLIKDGPPPLLRHPPVHPVLPRL